MGVFVQVTERSGVTAQLQYIGALGGTGFTVGTGVRVYTYEVAETSLLSVVPL